ncbi:MAG: hypothetical protein M3Q99_06970 [Acidobacteriota bacterium]|nr:hypothetical protein [Acidobacteriota bacterium]
MKAIQTENELILEETPGCLWIFGMFFVCVGAVFVYGSLGGLTDYERHTAWTLALAFLMGSSAIAVGIWIIYRAPITKVVINRIEDTVLMTRYGLFGKQITAYHFDEIEQFCLVAEKDSEGSDIWSVGIQMTNGEMIIVTSSASHFEDYERKYVFQTNEFMRKQIPPAQMILDFEDEEDAEMR